MIVRPVRHRPACRGVPRETFAVDPLETSNYRAAGYGGGVIEHVCARLSRNAERARSPAESATGASPADARSPAGASVIARSGRHAGGLAPMKVSALSVDGSRSNRYLRALARADLGLVRVTHAKVGNLPRSRGLLKLQVGGELNMPHSGAWSAGRGGSRSAGLGTGARRPRSCSPGRTGPTGWGSACRGRVQFRSRRPGFRAAVGAPNQERARPHRTEQRGLHDDASIVSNPERIFEPLQRDLASKVLLRGVDGRQLNHRDSGFVVGRGAAHDRSVLQAVPEAPKLPRDQMRDLGTAGRFDHNQCFFRSIGSPHLQEEIDFGATRPDEGRGVSCYPGVHSIGQEYLHFGRNLARLGGPSGEPGTPPR